LRRLVQEKVESPLAGFLLKNGRRQGKILGKKTANGVEFQY
jgi:hypothetical protein